MSPRKTLFDPTEYVAAMDYEYAGMINALSYLSAEAEAAKLTLVSLHLKIAIAELREYPARSTAEE